MRWFRPAVSASATGWFVAFVGVMGGSMILEVTNSGISIRRIVYLFDLFLLTPASYFIAIMAYRHLTNRDPVDETRCRKCQYILRGITEPRCPECGERI